MSVNFGHNLGGYGYRGSRFLPGQYYDGDRRIAPTNHSSNLSVYEQIAALRELVRQLVEEFGGAEAEYTERIAEWQKVLDDALASVAEQLDIHIDRVAAMVETAQNQTIVRNPTTGALYESLDVALSNVYDRARVHGLFMEDYEALDLTMEQYDALDLTMWEYDLGPQYAIDPKHAAWFIPGKESV